MTQRKEKVGILTAGGLAPCLAAAVGGLIERYSELRPEIEILGYVGGYRGLLLGQSLAVTEELRKTASSLLTQGGSPIKNSRVKLTNVKDCVKRGYVKEGEIPLNVAAERLVCDGITILHTIGGDDTNTAASDLARHLSDAGHDLTVVGLPKTVDNDIFPIRQSLGAITAADQGARYFENVVHEGSSNPRTLIVHEVMGRHSGWLTAATARVYRQRLARAVLAPGCFLDRARRDIDAVYVPEMTFDLEAEAARLRRVMDEKDSVNIFVSEGACVDRIVDEVTARGEQVARDAFGHVKLDAINIGDWFARQFSKLLGAERQLVQKSGYFARSAAPNAEDSRLIQSMVDTAVECGLRGEAGVIGHDEDRDGRLRAIEFSRIKGGKPFDIEQRWFAELLAEIGQPKRETSH